MGANGNVGRAFSQAANLAGAGRLSHAAPAVAARGDPGRGGNTGRQFAPRSALKSSTVLIGADELGAGDDVRLHRRLGLGLRFLTEISPHGGTRRVPEAIAVQ